MRLEKPTTRRYVSLDVTYLLIYQGSNRRRGLSSEGIEASGSMNQSEDLRDLAEVMRPHYQSMLVQTLKC